jgi:MSHA biogenesis protein MshM
MLLAICEELKIKVEPVDSSHRVVKELKRCLLAHARAGRRVVLLIDEAQCIPDETVEVLRLMSNIETEKRKLLQIVLFGQPELDVKLAQPHLRQLLQRITFADNIEPMCAEEIGLYIAHRLKVAGATDVHIFNEPAIEELSRRSGGIPRLINVIAHKSMMLAFGEGVKNIAAHHVTIAANDTSAAIKPMPRDSWLKRLFASNRRGVSTR